MLRTGNSKIQPYTESQVNVICILEIPKQCKMIYAWHPIKAKIPTFPENQFIAKPKVRFG
jgi:hypothetical protein